MCSFSTVALNRMHMHAAATQAASTLIAALGFGGYAPPPAAESLQPCSPCAPATFSLCRQAASPLVSTLAWRICSLQTSITAISYFTLRFCLLLLLLPQTCTQAASTLIAALGFGGYAPPPAAESLQPCSLCATSLGHHPAFWPSGRVPIAGTEGRFIASVIGCTYYVVVAWIW